MSAYKGQRGPNVSQYIANLNQPSPPQGFLDEQAPLEEDFSAFLNDNFFEVKSTSIEGFDFPLDPNINLPAEQTSQPNLGAESDKDSIHASLDTSMNFDMNGDFAFTDFSNYGANSLLDPTLSGLSQPSQPQPQQNNYPLPPNYQSPTSTVSPLTQGFDQSAKKRKLDQAAPVAPHATPHQGFDDAVRLAAEEDKRRRNTAASARFRVKKKQREQALEQTAKEMQDKATRLEQKVQQLETENAWLKSLITEKNGGKHTTSDLKALLSKHEEATGRSSPTHTDGVGTKA